MKEKSPFQDVINRFLSTYEKAKLRYSSACNRIQELKTTSILDQDEQYIEVNNENIVNCNTLPRIEKICRKAKKLYLEALNMPGRSGLPEKVSKIYHTAENYYYALSNRERLMNELKEARREKNQAWQKIRDIAYATESIKEKYS